MPTSLSHATQPAALKRRQSLQLGPLTTASTNALHILWPAQNRQRRCQPRLVVRANLARFLKFQLQPRAQ